MKCAMKQVATTEKQGPSIPLPLLLFVVLEISFVSMNTKTYFVETLPTLSTHLTLFNHLFQCRNWLD